MLRLLLILLLFSSPVWRQLPHRADPGEVGFSRQRLALTGERMRSEVAAGRLPGGVGLIVRRGKLAYLESWGMRDRGAGLPMTPDTIFRIHSMTKPVTAVAVLMLEEEGRFSLSDPVSRHRPEWEGAEMLVGAGDAVRPRKTRGQITIRHLLAHMSGLTYGNGDNPRLNRTYRESGSMKRDRPLAEIMGRLAGVPLAFEPGTRWEYGMSIDVLGRLVEAVAGMPLDRFFEERIFAPLGMEDTGFHGQPAQQGRLANLYTAGPDGGLRVADAEVADAVRSPPRSTTCASAGCCWPVASWTWSGCWPGARWNASGATCSGIGR